MYPALKSQIRPVSPSFRFPNKGLSEEPHIGTKNLGNPLKAYFPALTELAEEGGNIQCIIYFWMGLIAVVDVDPLEAKEELRYLEDLHP